MNLTNLNLNRKISAKCRPRECTDTYLICGFGVLLEVLYELEYLVLVNVADGWRVVEELNLHLGQHLLLQIAVGSDRKGSSHLQFENH